MKLRRSLIAALVLVAAMAGGAFGSGPTETPGKLDLEAATVAGDLRGWPVVGDGGEIGTVQNLLYDAAGDIEKVRARLSLHMGLGEHVVDIPAHLLSLTRDAVILHVSVEEIAADLPAIRSDRAEPPAK
jgi:hypothetical protein